MLDFEAPYGANAFLGGSWVGLDACFFEFPGYAWMLDFDTPCGANVSVVSWVDLDFDTSYCAKSLFGFSWVSLDA